MPGPPPGFFDAKRLVDARDRHGLTRADLALAVGTDVEVVAEWEDRGVTPTVRYLPKIAEAVGLTVEDLYRPAEGSSGLAALRVRAGLSQRKVAQLAGVPQTAVSRLERGEATLTPELAVAYAGALGVGEDEVERAARGPRRRVPPGHAEPEGRRADHLVVSHPAPGELVEAYRPKGPWGPAEAADPPADHAPVPAGPGRHEGSLTSVETRIERRGGPPISIRCQTDPADPMRVLTARLLSCLLAGAEPGDDPLDPRALVPDLRSLLLSFHLGTNEVETVYIAARPTDTWDWLASQLRPDTQHVALFVEPDRDPLRSVVPVDIDGRPIRYEHPEAVRRADQVARELEARAREAGEMPLMWTIVPRETVGPPPPNAALRKVASRLAGR